MEQWYKDGEIYNSLTAIRNKMKEVSLPMLLTDSLVAELGFIKVVDAEPQYDEAIEYITDSGIDMLAGVPTKIYTITAKTTEQLQAEQLQAMQSLVQHFTDVTTAYIESKVTSYNKAHGLAFANIDAFTKYAINPLSQHYAIANQFINYADKVWKAVRDYQATATTIPADVEFKAVLDAVVF